VLDVIRGVKDFEEEEELSEVVNFEDI
jgi:hypothetical protein